MQNVIESAIVCVHEPKKKQFIMTFFTSIYIKTYIESHLGSFLLSLRVHVKSAIIDFEVNKS